MRSGDEPRNARSPLRLRLGLAVFGVVTALIAAFVVRNVAPGLVVIAFVVVAVIAAVDLVVVVSHLRRGPHYQPGPGVPPYRPVDQPKPAREAVPIGERARMHRYFAIMITCLVLITLAWTVVRFYSVTIAVVMSAIAAVLPPIAVIVANFGVELPPDPPSPPNPPPPTTTGPGGPTEG